MSEGDKVLHPVDSWGPWVDDPWSPDLDMGSGVEFERAVEEVRRSRSIRTRLAAAAEVLRERALSGHASEDLQEADRPGM